MPRLCLAPLLLLTLLPGVSQGRFEPALISQNGRETHLASVPRGADDLVLMNEVVRLTRFDAAGSVLGEEQHTQDSNGNRIQEADLRLFWDSFDRLVRVERTSDGVVVGRYRYDALGRRVDRSFVVQGEVASQQVFHVHDGAREVEELDAAGNVLADFVWGGMYVDELVQLRRGGQTWYAHSSSIYSVAALSDSAGNAVERYAYASIYGVCQVQDGAGAPKAPAAEVGNPWRFQGRRFDPETGFYHFRARQLDPARGRFVSRDPLGLWGDPGQVGNSYSFVANDPVNGVDPFGDEAVLIAGGIVAGGEAAGAGAAVAAPPVAVVVAAVVAIGAVAHGLWELWVAEEALEEALALEASVEAKALEEAARRARPRGPVDPPPPPQDDPPPTHLALGLDKYAGKGGRLDEFRATVIAYLGTPLVFTDRDWLPLTREPEDPGYYFGFQLATTYASTIEFNLTGLGDPCDWAKAAARGATEFPMVGHFTEWELWQVLNGTDLLGRPLISKTRFWLNGQPLGPVGFNPVGQ